MDEETYKRILDIATTRKGFASPIILEYFAIMERYLAWGITEKDVLGYLEDKYQMRQTQPRD